MRSLTRKRFGAVTAAVPVVVAAAVVVVLLVLPGPSPPPRPAPASRPDAVLTVGGPMAAPPIPVGFMGFSTEYDAIEPYAGSDPRALNPVFVRLIANLTRGQPSSLRIGGDSADHTWWPVAGLTQPPGVTYSLGWRWLDRSAGAGWT